jgi:hypothetical protein
MTNESFERIYKSLRGITTAVLAISIFMTISVFYFYENKGMMCLEYSKIMATNTSTNTITELLVCTKVLQYDWVFPTVSIASCLLLLCGLGHLEKLRTDQGLT